MDFNRVLTALQQSELRHKHHGTPKDLQTLKDLRDLFSHLLGGLVDS